jgi:hypothetical protein
MLRHRRARRGGCCCTPPVWSTKARTDGPRLPSRRAISRSDSPRRHRAHTSCCSAADSPQDRTHHLHPRYTRHAEAMQPPIETRVVSRSSRSPSNWLRILRWVASCWRAPPGRSRTMRPTSGRRYANNSTDLYALASRLTALCIPRAVGRPSPTADPPSRSFPDHSCSPQGSVLLT